MDNATVLTQSAVAAQREFVVAVAPRVNATKAAQLHQINFRAMGCAMGAWVLTTEAEMAAERLNLVRTWMALADAALSRFQPDSELSRLNATPGVPKEVSSLLWDALDWALYAAAATDGCYDPTVLPALVAAGYDRDFDEMRGDAVRAGWDPEIQQPGWDSQLDWRAVERNGMHHTVTLPLGVRIDLGGTAKGWAAARAADMLAPLGPCLVDAGGDVAARGGLYGTAGWPVGVADPLKPGSRVTTLTVFDRGIATSGIDYRRWRRRGVDLHHLIDPRTQRPVQTDLVTATVIAPDVAWADLHALVVMLLGRENGWTWLLEHQELEGLLIDRSGRTWATPGLVAYEQRSVGTIGEVQL